jgi:hypothetical protein
MVQARMDKWQHNEKEGGISMVGLLSLPPELIRLIGDKVNFSLSKLPHDR